MEIDKLIHWMTLDVDFAGTQCFGSRTYGLLSSSQSKALRVNAFICHVHLCSTPILSAKNGIFDIHSP